jgi:excisionase family DNA binding protein
MGETLKSGEGIPSATFDQGRESESCLCEFLKAEDIASELKSSKPHVYKLIAGKIKNVSRLPALEMGRCKRIRRSTFEEWKKANENKNNDDSITSPKTNAVDALRRQ